jgi:predicted phage tail protein
MTFATQEAPLRNLHIHGPLGDRYGKTHRVAAATVPDALRIIACNVDRAFERDMSRGDWHVTLGEEELMAEELNFPRSKADDFHLYPAIEGQGGGGGRGKAILSIVIGGVLLFTGVGGALGAQIAGKGLASGFAASAASFGGLSISYSTVTLLGAAFALGGLARLMAPGVPQDTGKNDPTNFTFSGAPTTDKEGSPIPICYGLVWTGGLLAAAGIEVTGGGYGGGYGSGGVGGGGGVFDNLFNQLL